MSVWTAGWEGCRKGPRGCTCLGLGPLEEMGPSHGQGVSQQPFPRLSQGFPGHSSGEVAAEAVPLAGEEPEPQEVE